MSKNCPRPNKEYNEFMCGFSRDGICSLYIEENTFACKTADEFLETSVGKKNAERSIFNSGIREFEYVKG